MHEIILSVANGVVIAETVGGEAEKSIRALFGTNRLPTPFTAKADPREVQKKIVSLNPGVSVRWGNVCAICGVKINSIGGLCDGETCERAAEKIMAEAA
jgi:hypothetical protein